MQVQCGQATTCYVPIETEYWRRTAALPAQRASSPELFRGPRQTAAGRFGKDFSAAFAICHLIFGTAPSPNTVLHAYTSR
jgi:hypothetical protein